jgi:hypothetical protein
MSHVVPDDGSDPDELEPDEELTVERDLAPESDDVLLPSGDALDIEGVDAFLRWRSAILVSIVGDVGSGKTTLICAIYDQFLRGPFAGLIFAGSRTLMAFEQRSHYSRVESGGVRPDTQRTSLAEGLGFFHIALVRSDPPHTRTDLMISDRSGEVYKEARSNSAIIPKLIEISKADYVVLLLDGAGLADPAKRAGALGSLRQTLQALLDGDALDLASQVQVVTTKLDLIEKHADQYEIEERLARFQSLLSRDFAHRLGGLSFWAVAARADDHTYPSAKGVDSLLGSWVEPAAIVVSPTNRTMPHLESEFDRLLSRTSFEGWT